MTLARKTLKWRHEENGGFLFHHCFKASRRSLASAFCISWESGYLLLQEKLLLGSSNSLKLLRATRNRLEVRWVWCLKLGPTAYTPSWLWQQDLKSAVWKPLLQWNACNAKKKCSGMEQVFLHFKRQCNEGITQQYPNPQRARSYCRDMGKSACVWYQQWYHHAADVLICPSSATLLLKFSP